MAKGYKSPVQGNRGEALKLWREKQAEDKKKQEIIQEEKELQEAGLIPFQEYPKEEVKPQEIAPEEPVKVKEQPQRKRTMELAIDPSKKYRFELVEKSPASRNVIIGTEGKIFDTEQNRIREIRYIPVANSIYVDEMDESFKLLSPPYIGFNNNFLTVSGTDARLIEYLMAHDDNESNPKRLNKRAPVFRLIDKILLEKQKTASYDLVDEARVKIKEKDAEELRPIARIMFGIHEEDDDALRNALRDKINHTDINQSAANARIVMDNIMNPKLDRQYTILKAFDKGIIRLETDKNSVVWTNTGHSICQVRSIRDQNKTAGEVAEWTFLDQEQGEKFWEIISKKI